MRGGEGREENENLDPRKKQDVNCKTSNNLHGTNMGKISTNLRLLRNKSNIGLVCLDIQTSDSLFMMSKFPEKSIILAFCKLASIF